MIIDELAITKERDDSREGRDKIRLTLPKVRELELTEADEERGIPVDPISPAPTGDAELDLEEFGGDTIVVKPLISGVAATDKEVSQGRLRRSGRQHFGGRNYARAMVANIGEPHTLREALEREDSREWREARVSEVDSLARNNTWRLEPLPLGREAIRCRWLFKRKEDGRYKARLVAKGYAQPEEVDYTEPFPPVARFNSLCSLLALVGESDWEQEGMDVETAFLNSEIEETVYMDIPEDLELPGSTHTSSPDRPIVCRFTKSIYGLKQ